MVNCCGLVSQKNVPVPLKSISVQLQVQDHVASVSSSLQYINEEDRPLEAVFVFPLPADAAVCHFSARIGEQEIVAEVQDKQSARDQYDDAVSSGQQAFLLEESDQSSDVFRLSVGCLSPGQNASITIVYIIELSVQADNALRFCLPAVLNPRYTPAASAAGVPEVSSASVVPYTLSLSVEVRSSDRISRLESSCPLDPLEFLDAQHTHATVNLSAGHRFDKDVELLLYYENTHQPSAVVEAGAAAAQSGSLMGDPALMISLYPEFPADVMSSLASQGEFIFVVDRSGSMGCAMHHGKDAQKRIESARDTLLLLLKSLPMGCYFNIYGFGSRFESFFPQSVVYSEDAMEEALKRVKSMSSDMGGTEILRPLKHIYSQPCYTDHPRQLLETEGAVTVKYRLKDQPVTNQLQFTLKPAEDTGLTIHRLAARSVIRSLELQDRAGGAAGVENIRSRIVALSVQAGVSSVHTAFIGVNKDSRQTMKGPLLQRRVLTERLRQRYVAYGASAKMSRRVVIKEFCSIGRSYAETKAMHVDTEPCIRTNALKSASNHVFFQSTECSMMVASASASHQAEPELQKDPLLQLVSLQKAVGCWELNAALAGVFGKTEDEVTNHRPAQVDGSVWATVLALIWLYSYKLDQQVEWQFVAMKAASWIRSQKPGGLSQCVCDGNLLLGSQLTEDTLGV
ncbi:von Willebrand factor A domain-containing protein 5A-like [Sinocyclocheilus grahami]|uniref:von Willebrand factor A domain-containing protein 5A-like n=1 Tax=Sinocyclocheilus grahami TaxID=75366 RepID=UPI0007ACF4EF|nr:PREDICTED: von Willebrand factor A domain-containing protein 5A-like [Sinocyclocheilus grahami]